MPWYQFNCDDFPSSEALDMVEDFMDTMLTARNEGGLDRRFGLFMGRQKSRRDQTYYVYADTDAFQRFLDDYRAHECKPPAEAEHISGTNVLQNATGLDLSRPLP